ncbi:MAG: hypothetical protein ABI186_00035, partial [Candidatus Elarobacter sp.]
MNEHGWPRIPLEDDPADVLRKAQRGARIDIPELAHRTGIDEAVVQAWRSGDAVPSEDQARAVA